MKRTAALVAIGLLLPGCGQARPARWRLVGAGATTLTLEVEVPGAASSCNRLLPARVTETADTVDVTVPIRSRAFATTCTDDLQIRSVSVELDAPLGDRALTGCGEESCGVIGPPLLPRPAP